MLYIEIGQRYSLLIKLDRSPGNYYLRFQSYPMGDMQQVIEGKAVVSYTPSHITGFPPARQWTLTNGSAFPGSSVLDPNALLPSPATPPPWGKADIVKYFTINQTGITTWVIDRAPYEEAKVPILEGEKSDGWGAATTVHLEGNKTVDLVMKIAEDSMDVVSAPLFPIFAVSLHPSRIATAFVRRFQFLVSF